MDRKRRTDMLGSPFPAHGVDRLVHERYSSRFSWKNQLLVMSTISSVQLPLRIRVGLVFRAARLARGLTQGELAGPYTAAFVSRVEHGDAIPSLGSLEVLTARLAMTLEEFFRLVEQQDGGEVVGMPNDRSADSQQFAAECQDRPRAIESC